MRLSFDDEESFKEAIENLCFNNPSSDPNIQQQMGSNNTSMALEKTERNEDNNTPSDPITTLRRVGSGSSLSIQEIRRSADIQVSFDNPHWQAIPNLNSLIERYRREIKILRDIDFLAIITNTTY